jgi:hypothetical protein
MKSILFLKIGLNFYKMSEKNTLKSLKITMKKHPDSLKLEGSLKEILQNKLPLKEPLIIYEGISD